MKTAILDVDVEFLSDSLGFPEEVKIADCRMSFTRPGIIEFRIESNLLSDIAEGMFIPRVTAIYEEGDFQGFK